MATRVPSDERATLIPNWSPATSPFKLELSCQRALGWGLPKRLVGGLTEGVVEGLTEGLVNGLPVGPVNGLPEGLVIGLPEGLVLGLPEGLVEGLPEGLAKAIPEALAGRLLSSGLGSSSGPVIPRAMRTPPDMAITNKNKKSTTQKRRGSLVQDCMKC